MIVHVSQKQIAAYRGGGRPYRYPCPIHLALEEEGMVAVSVGSMSCTFVNRDGVRVQRKFDTKTQDKIFEMDFGDPSEPVESFDVEIEE